MKRTKNIFHIIIGTQKEDYHDRVLEWLLDPKQPHGLKNRFSAELIYNLTGQRSSESIIKIKRAKAATMSMLTLNSPFFINYTSRFYCLIQQTSELDVHFAVMCCI